MKHLRYYYEFYDRENVLYRVEILQEAETAYTPQEVTLASDGVTIEWPEVKKIDPLVCSGATLRLVSMTDRQFVDLYSVEACAIRMDIYRAGTLYWSGTLDTELFEEPYSQADRYITEVTFSDFGVLDRLYWEQMGIASIKSIIDTCLSAAQINYLDIEKSISTTIPNVSGDLLESCSLTLANFYDEDGEAWPIKQVLEEVLRPFALQLKQKNGKIHIYDLNSLSSATPQEVEWRGANAQLGVESTYNRVELTYSPYSQTTIFDGNFNVGEILPNPDADGIMTMKIPLPDTDFNGFNLYVGPRIEEPTSVQGVIVGVGARLFRIEPENSGSEAVGVLWGWKNRIDSWIGNAPIDNSNPASDSSSLMETPKIPVQSGGAYNIRISLEVLFDARVNPFESGGYNNDEQWEIVKDYINFVAIPCTLLMYTPDGKVYSYNNSYSWDNIIGDEGNFQQQYNSNQGRWIEGEGGITYLTYYNERDRIDDTGIGEWKGNKQNIGRWIGELPKNITLNIDGEKLPNNKVGELKLIVRRGARYSRIDKQTDVAINEFTTAKQYLRWQLYRNLQIDIVERSGRKIDVEDVEFSAWINRAAREDLPINTYVGSLFARLPMAQGVIMKNDTSEAISLFSRAGISDKIEKLLIGTIYSNYASRRNVLSGTIKLIPQNAVLSDKSSVNSRYVILSLTENLAHATAEVKMAEFDKDSYEGIEYE